VYFSFGKTFAVGNPFFDAGHRLLGGQETSAQGGVGIIDEVGQYVVSFAVGNDNGNTFIGHFAGNVSLGKHTTPSETRLTRLNVVRQVFPSIYFSDY